MQTQADKLIQLLKPPTKNHKITTISISSGKGGVGKSTICANIATILSNHNSKVIILDCDIGLANLDIMFNVKSNKNFLHLVKGEASIEDVAIQINENLILIPNHSGEEILKINQNIALDKFYQEISHLNGYDYIIMDMSAGIGESNMPFIQSSDEKIIVMTTEPTSITDAYALSKVISKDVNKISYIINMVDNGKQAMSIFNKIKNVASKNISKKIEYVYLGYIRKDNNIPKSINKRFVLYDEIPYSKSAIDMKDIARNLVKNIGKKGQDMEYNMLENKEIESFFTKVIGKLASKI